MLEHRQLSYLVEFAYKQLTIKDNFSKNLIIIYNEVDLEK